MAGSVLVAGARTPIGKLLGELAGVQAVDLGEVAVAAALERAGSCDDVVDYVILGQVLQAGAGQNPARQAAVKGGVPMGVPALTVNKVCLAVLTRSPWATSSSRSASSRSWWPAAWSR